MQAFYRPGKSKDAPSHFLKVMNEVDKTIEKTIAKASDGKKKDGEKEEKSEDWIKKPGRMKLGNRRLIR